MHSCREGERDEERALLSSSSPPTPPKGGGGGSKVNVRPKIGNRIFFQVCYVGVGAKGTRPPLPFPQHNKKGAGLELVHLGLESTAIFSGSGLTHCTTLPALSHFLINFEVLNYF